VEDFEGRRRKGLVDRALEPPVHIVVKFPCVALRYPTSLTLVSSVARRVQFLVARYSVAVAVKTLETLTGSRFTLTNRFPYLASTHPNEIQKRC
jgi:hypothetical protein